MKEFLIITSSSLNCRRWRLFCDVVNYLTAGRAGADERECLGKELAALRRTLDEETYEKDVLQKTANDLRQSVVKLEMEKLENSRASNDLRQRISGTFCWHSWRTQVDCSSRTSRPDQARPASVRRPTWVVRFE